jgi:hypothetical protein
MKSMQQRIHQREARLMKAYRELERLDGEHGGPVIMSYDIAEALKVNVLVQLGQLERIGC